MPGGPGPGSRGESDASPRFRRWSGEGWFRLYLSALLLVLVLFAGYFFLYVRHQERLLADFHLRLLSSAGTNIGVVLDRLKLNVENTSFEPGARADEIRRKLRQVRGLIDWREVPRAHGGPETTGAVPERRTHRAHALARSNPDSFPIDRTEVTLERVEGAYSVVIRGHPAELPPDETDGSVALSRAPLDDLLGGILPLEVFERVLVTSRSGELLLQAGRGPVQISGLWPTLPTAKDSVRSVERLGAASQIRHLDLGGTAYTAFVQPVNLPIELRWRSEDGRTGSPDTPWFIVGFVRSADLRGASVRISPNVVLIVLLVMGIAILTIPYLRIRHLGTREALRPIDVLSAMTSLAVGAAVVALAVVHVVSYAQHKRVRDDHLKSLAERITDQLETDLNSAELQLERLNRVYFANLKAPTGRERFARRDSVSILATSDTTLGAYPDLEMAYWMDSTGLQTAKWTIRPAATSKVNVSDRDYFRTAVEGPLWPAGGGLRPRFVEVIGSRVTGEVSATLSLPTGDRAIPVAALLTFPHSTIRPVLPAGYHFCIIDERGLVLFHENYERNLVENFFEELDASEHARAAVDMRHEAALDLQYGVAPIRAVLSPLKRGDFYTPWTVVVYTERGPLRMLATEVLTSSLMAFTLLLAVLVLLGIRLHSIRPRKAGATRSVRWYWPVRRDGPRYFACLVSLVGLALGACLLSLFTHSSTGVLLALAFPVAGEAIPFVVLCRPAGPALRVRDLLWLSAFAAVAIGHPPGFLLWLGAAVVLVIGSKRPTLIYLFVAVFCAVSAALWKNHALLWPGLVAGTVLVLSLLVSTARRTPSWVQSRWQSVYAAACLAFIVLLSIPAIAIYRAIDRDQTTLVTRYHQKQLVAALESRTSILRRQYEGVMLSRSSADRLQARLFPGSFDSVQGVYHLPGEDIKCRQEPSSARGSPAAGGSAARPGTPGTHPFWWTRLWAGVPPQFGPVVARTHFLADDLQLLGDLEQGSLSFRGAAVAGPVSLGRTQGQDRELADAKGQVWIRTPINWLPFGASEWLLLAIAGIVTLAVLFAALGRLLRRAFLTDLSFPVTRRVDPSVSRPSHLGRPGEAEHRLFIRPTHRDQRTIYASGPSIHTISAWMVRSTANAEDLVNAARSSGQSEIVVESFDDGLDEPAIEEKRLVLLEGLLAPHGPRVTILTDIDPMYLLKTQVDDKIARSEPSTMPIERWARVLERFVKIREPVRVDVFRARPIALARLLRRRFDCRAIARGLGHEGWPSLHLRRIVYIVAEEPGIQDLDPHAVIDHVYDLAVPYYRRLWASCSTDEKILLHRLARGYFVNWRMQDTLRSLLRRRLVVMSLGFHPMNESFRRFVIAEVPEWEVLRWEREVEPGLWSRLRGPSVLALAVVAGLFFATQEDARQQAFGALAALTAAAPLLIRLVGSLAQSHSPDQGRS